MGYNSKLEQTNRRVAKAKRKYYGSFDYGSGVRVKSKGGSLQLFPHTEPFNSFDAGGWVKGLSAGAGIASSAYNLAKPTTSYDDWRNGVLYQQRGFDNMLSGITDNSSLLSAYDAYGEYSAPIKNTFDNRTDFEKFLGVASMATAGAAAGHSIAPGIGTAIGAGVGILGGAIGLGVNSYLNDKYTKQGTALTNSLNVSNATKLAKTATLVDTMNDRRRKRALMDTVDYAFGGPMSHGEDFNNGLTFINAGGSHETNPNEGVPVGVDSEGIPNLVEEGEVIWNNDYVFSDRTKIPEELAKKYGLGGDLSFADAIKEVTKESEMRPNDPISNITNKAIVEEFMEAQEGLRQKEQIQAAKEYNDALDAQFMDQLALATQGIPQEQGMAMPAPQGYQQEPYPMQDESMTPPGYAKGGHLFKKGGSALTLKRTDSVYYPSGPKVDANIAKRIVALKELGLLWNEDEVRDVLDYEHHPETTGDFLNQLENIYRKATRGLSNYEKDSPKYREVLNAAKAELESTYRETLNKYKAEREQTKQTRDKERAESEIAKQRQEAANQYLVNRGYKLKPKDSFHKVKGTMDGEDYRIYRDILAGKRDSSGNLISPGNQDTAKASTKQPIQTLSSQATADNVETKNTKQDAESSADVEDTVLSKYTDFASESSAKSNEKLGVKGARTKSASTVSSATSASESSDKQSSSSPLIGNDPLLNELIKNFSYYNSPDGLETSADEYDEDLQNSKLYFGRQQSAQPATVSPDTYSGMNTSADNEYDEALQYDKVYFGNPPARIVPRNVLNTQPTVTPFDYLAGVSEEADRERDAIIEDALFGLTPRENGVSEYDRRKAINDRLKILDRTVWEQTHPDVVSRTPKPVAVSPKQESPIDKAIKASQQNSGQNVTAFDWEREAPIVVSGLAALYGLTGSPDYSNVNPLFARAEALGAPVSIPVETIGDYVQARPFDERYLVNQATQARNAAYRGAMGTSGGNRAMQLGAQSYLAGAYQNNLAEIMRQAYLANRQDALAAAEFNRGTNLQNMSAINARNTAQAQLNSHRQQAGYSALASAYGMKQGIRDAWDAATERSLNTFIQNLGLKGKETKERERAVSYATEGGYALNLTPDELYEYNKYLKSKGKQTVAVLSARGGKLRKKRRF